MPEQATRILWKISDRQRLVLRSVVSWPVLSLMKKSVPSRLTSERGS
jgi:hypothetical protein